ncbi:MAG: DedA family protein [Candidatus Thiodiazotropha sp. (ex Ctena orbiculata)]|nr:DedA family protein [Candidatus Thiodiazotropha taylori]
MSSILTLFGSSFLASTLLPGGSEAILIWYLQQDTHSTQLLWLTATLGNTLGGLSSWLIGWWLAKRFPQKGLKDQRQRQALDRIGRYGSPVLLLSWLPVVGDPLCLAAGWAGVRLSLAMLFIGIGKGIRYAVVIWLSEAAL